MKRRILSYLMVLVVLGICAGLAYFLDGFHQHFMEKREDRIQQVQDSINGLNSDSVIPVLETDSLTDTI